VRAGERLARILRILERHGPVNLGDDSRGGVFTGFSVQELVEGAHDRSYMAAVFGSRRQLEGALKELKEADLGISIVVSGELSEVFAAAEAVGLRPHTVHLSLGVWGKRELLPDDEVLEIASMCGHGMISCRHVEEVRDKVRAGKMSPEDAARALARACTCGIFNPERAARVLERRRD